MELLDQSLDSIISAGTETRPQQQRKPMSNRFSPYGGSGRGSGRGGNNAGRGGQSESGKIGEELDKNVVFPGVVIRVRPVVWL